MSAFTFKASYNDFLIKKVGRKEKLFIPFNMRKIKTKIIIRLQTGVSGSRTSDYKYRKRYYTVIWYHCKL